MREQVIQYMVREYGFYLSKATELVDRHIEHVRDAERFGSMPYFAASRIIRDECIRLSVSRLPDELFDPAWVDPELQEDDVSSS